MGCSENPGGGPAYGVQECAFLSRPPRSLLGAVLSIWTDIAPLQHSANRGLRLSRGYRSPRSPHGPAASGRVMGPALPVTPQGTGTAGPVTPGKPCGP